MDEKGVLSKNFKIKFVPKAVSTGHGLLFIENKFTTLNLNILPTMSGDICAKAFSKGGNMYALAINKSPRKDGNTYTMLQEILRPLVQAGWKTEHIQVGGKDIRGCIACYKCFENKDQRCSVTTDMFNMRHLGAVIAWLGGAIRDRLNSYPHP